MTQKEAEIQFVGTQKNKKCCFCGSEDRIKYKFNDDKYLCDLCVVSINFLRDQIKKGNKMTQKERLVELLRKEYGSDTWLTSEVCDFTGTSIKRTDLQTVGDYLLSNGVIVPPCKVGDQIFIGSGEFKDARMAEVIKIIFSLEKNEIIYRPIDFHGMKLKSSFSEFGKNIFSTPEEAEQALKEREARGTN